MTKKSKWIVLISFSILYCFLYLGRFNLSSVQPAILAETAWTELDLGFLSAIFFWTYGMGHLFTGRLGEIFGLKRFIVCGMLLSIFLNVMIGFQSNFTVICLLWGLNGFAQSMLWSPGVALIRQYWPQEQIGFATGFANALSGCGQVLSMLSVVAGFYLLPSIGWRSAFVFPMIVMLIVTILFLLSMKSLSAKDSYQLENTTKRTEKKSVSELLYPYAYLFKSIKFDAWIFIIASSSLARYGLLTWIPTYYVQEFGVDVKDGIMGSLLLPLGMAFGTFIIPTLTDRYCKNDRLPAVILCSGFSAIIVWLFTDAQPGVYAGILLFFAGFFVYAINGLAWAFAADIGGKEYAGTATGVLDAFAYLGASVQAIFFGAILKDSLQNWNFVFLSIAAVCLAMCVIAVVTYLSQKGTSFSG